MFLQFMSNTNFTTNFSNEISNETQYLLVFDIPDSIRNISLRSTRTSLAIFDPNELVDFECSQGD